MSSSSSHTYRSHARVAGTKSRSARDVSDFLRTHDKVGALIPAAQRLVKLQKACESCLPAIFEVCSVMQFDAGQLILVAPNAAFFSKLKQQLPKLQDFLQKQGWQVNAIRIKVQVEKTAEKSIASKQLSMSNRAVAAFTELESSLPTSPRNEALKTALQTLLQRHRK